MSFETSEDFQRAPSSSRWRTIGWGCFCLACAALLVVNWFQWREEQKSSKRLQVQRQWLETEKAFKEFRGFDTHADRIGSLMENLVTSELVDAVTRKVNSLDLDYMLMFSNRKTGSKRWFIYCPDESQTLILKRQVELSSPKTDSDERSISTLESEEIEIKIPPRRLQVLWLGQVKTQSQNEMQLSLNEKVLFRQALEDSAPHGSSSSHPTFQPIASPGTLGEIPYDFKRTLETGNWLRLLDYRFNLNFYLNQPRTTLIVTAELRTSGNLFLAPDLAGGAGDWSVSNALKQADLFADEYWDNERKGFRIDPKLSETISSFKTRFQRSHVRQNVVKFSWQVC